MLQFKKSFDTMFTLDVNILNALYMSYNFKKVESRNARTENRITITKSNGIGFPTKFYKDNKINEFKYVVLYFDTDQKALGLQFSNDEAERNKFSILHSHSGYGGSIVARSFFKTYGIDPNKYYGRYQWKIELQENIGNLYVINLKERENIINSK